MDSTGPTPRNSDIVEAARSRWLAASECASSIAAGLFQDGSGYGSPEARKADEHRLQSAKDEAERLSREYYDLDRRESESKMFKLQRSMFKLQRSQLNATWASFVVATVVGFASIVGLVFALRK